MISPPNHFCVEDLEELLPPQLDYAFAIVRHPLSRIVSEYRYQKGLSRLSRFSFSTWLSVVLECAKREPRMYENHIRPQSDLIPEFAEVFRIEEGCDAVIQHIDELVHDLAPDVEVPHLNPSKKMDIQLTREDVLTVRNFYAVDYERIRLRLPGPRWLPA